MILNDIERIEELEHRVERSERRGFDDTVAKKELVEARQELIERLTKRRENYEDSTFAQRNRREQYDEILAEQREKLESAEGSRGIRLNIGDIVEIKS